MGPEGRAPCWCCGPEQSCWAAGGSPTAGHCGPCSQCGHMLGQDPSGTPWEGRDHPDGQVLGQLRALVEEEEEGAWASPSSRPAFPEMGSEELRLASFCGWPLTATVRPEVLAAAGFFHTGRQDKVRCFFCSGGLQTWQRGDDPWTEHAKWFPRCEFLLRTKGRDFVHSVQEALRYPLGSWDPWEEPADTAPATSAPVHLTPKGETRLADAREPGEYRTHEARWGQGRLCCLQGWEGRCSWSGPHPPARQPVKEGGGWGRGVSKAQPPWGTRVEPRPRQTQSVGSGAPRSPGRGGAAAAAAGGADLQGVPGPCREHRLRALRPPGLRCVCARPAALPPLQGPHPQLPAHLPVLGRAHSVAAT
ncbi:baculoviral IAP repeat-containing protein 7 isoform X1 [Artibeus jamaicensis]|uniref:baculoviral IAP repeat-containing protein 7 isoform X1 n=1 Tax=Artibeus jamaicensis TaxID=9417 RepID=UPI00235B0FC2|nr:baculoviral IAP repeat-containing protein 7 isoform X1 [Artibeus jamaicensis]